jgi:tetratricopeptide (TPR) repeat protein
LQRGLDGIPLELIDPEAARAALILVKVYLKQGDSTKAIEILEHPKYGPKTVMSGQGPPDEEFPSDLYSTELQAVVQLMTTDQGDPQTQLQRAIDVMDKLRESVAGPDAQQKLTAIYLRMARNIREQLDTAETAKKAKLIEAFRVFLDRIASTSSDDATLQWVGQTLRELGEASMDPGDVKLNGQAAALLTSAMSTFKSLQEKSKDQPLTVNYQLGRTYRLLGQYSDAINTLEKVLIEKPMMLDAQIEAAQAYESWAGVVAPKYQGRAYLSALNGARPAANKKKTIWGWGRISQLTNGKPQFDAIFFDARYHVALCRYKQGLATNDDRIKEQAISDIITVNALYPDLGGDSQRKKFDALLRTIQKDLGKPVQGLPKVEVKK